VSAPQGFTSLACNLSEAVQFSHRLDVSNGNVLMDAGLSAASVTIQYSARVYPCTASPRTYL
jgi:hypothetical protein